MIIYADSMNTFKVLSLSNNFINFANCLVSFSFFLQILIEPFCRFVRTYPFILLICNLSYCEGTTVSRWQNSYASRQFFVVTEFTFNHRFDSKTSLIFPNPIKYPIRNCQRSISLPYAGVHVSIRISRLYLRVYVLCTYRRTDLRPLVWNVAVCTCVLFEW